MTCTACGAASRHGDRFCPMCGAARDGGQGAGSEMRKTVTVLFIDLVDSTVLAERLDPEALRRIIDRYFAGCAAAIAAHGGVVEKFIGDAVMAVFGAAVSHEDDAIRAVRAAAESLEALDVQAAELSAGYQLDLAARCGICSGEVMVITFPNGDFRVVGDAVNTASRLQSAARPGAILVGSQTAALTGGQVELEPIPPLLLKGKAQPVPAWQVTSPASAASGRAASGRAASGRAAPDKEARQVPLIGRDDELDQLARSFSRVVRQQRPCLVTVLGPPGIGKTRLVGEFLAGLPGDNVLVMSGRCSAYGAGITYQPLADMIGSYPDGWAGLSRLMSTAPGHDSRVMQSLASVLDVEHGGDGPVTVTGVEEITWATRHMAEVLGGGGPVLLVWEDLHWAEPTLLNLIEEVADRLIDVPVMLVCVARTELLEGRPSWGGGKPSAFSMELAPLSYEQSATLVAELALTGDVYPHQQNDLAQVAAQCEGNPLFAELMLDVMTEIAPGAGVPPTVQALLGARLDQLPGDERLILEMAATSGREFSLEILGAIASTADLDEAQTRALATRLAGKRLLQRIGHGGFRFTQSLLRDTAYSFIPKARRDQWHTFLANWFSARRRCAEATRQDSLALAYHVETACLLRRELLSAEAGLEELAAIGADTLIAAGLEALARRDLPATIALLERARSLLPPGDPRHLWLALHICDSGISMWDAPRCEAALAAAEAALPDNPDGRATCVIQRCIVKLRLGLAEPVDVAAQAARVAAGLTPGDDLSWCRYYQLVAYLNLIEDQMAAAESALRLGLDRARSLRDKCSADEKGSAYEKGSACENEKDTVYERGSAYEEERLLCALCEVSQWAPLPVSAGLELCAELSARFAANRVLLVPILLAQTHLTALTGDLDRARELLATAQKYAGDLHLDVADAAAAEISGLVESLAGQYGAAETHYRRAAAMFRDAGQVRDALPLEIAAARAMLDQGNTVAAARALAALSSEEALMIPTVQLVFTALRARLASAAGEHSTATSLARQAWTQINGLDDPCLVGEVLLDVCRVLAAAAEPGPAVLAAERAVGQLAAKGATLPAARGRELLRSISGASVSGASVSGASDDSRSA
jgi:class 3 adenylate cyclase